MIELHRTILYDGVFCLPLHKNYNTIEFIKIQRRKSSTIKIF